MLKACCACASHGHGQFVTAVQGPGLFRRGRDIGEWNFHTRTGLTCLAHALHDLGQQCLLRRTVQGQGKLLQERVLDVEVSLLTHEIQAVGLDVFRVNAGWHLLTRVIGHQRVHAAACAAVHNTAQAPGTFFIEVCGKVRDHQKAIGLRQLACLFIVLFNGFKFIAQILLDHVLHVLREVFELSLNLGRLSPDASAHQALLVIACMHEACKVFAQAHGVYDGEAHLSGRQAREESRHHRAQRVNRFCASLAIGLHEQGAGVRKRQQGRDRDSALGTQRHAGSLEHAGRDSCEVQGQRAETQDRTRVRGRRPVRGQQRFKGSDGTRRQVLCPVQHVVDGRQVFIPAVCQTLQVGCVGFFKILQGLFEVGFKVPEVVLMFPGQAVTRGFPQRCGFLHGLIALGVALLL